MTEKVYSDKPFRELCRFIEKINYEELPLEVVAYVKILIADYHIASIAGYYYNAEYSRAVTEMFDAMGDGNPESSVFFSDKKRPMSIAAFLNATYCHGADIDDGHHRAEAHLGVTIIPAVFAMAEKMQSTGKDVLLAIVVGYEVFCRVAMAMLPNHMLRGFHVTGTVGAIAATAACAKLKKLNKEQIYTAISIATTQACGLVIIGESGQMCKPMNPARAVETGIRSVLLAEKGIVAFDNPFESRKGYYHAFSDKHNPELLSWELGSRYEILNCYIKLYPSCRHTHAGNDAMSMIVKKHGRIENVKKVTIRTYPHAVDIVGWNFLPRDKNEAKFSLPYTASCVALFGSYTLSNLANFETEKERVYEFASHMTILPDMKFEDMEQGVRGAEVIVETENNTYSEYVKMGSGEGETRVDWEKLTEKLVLSTKGTPFSVRAESLFEYCKTIDLQNAFASYILG